MGPMCSRIADGRAPVAAERRAFAIAWARKSAQMKSVECGEVVAIDVS